MGKEKELNPGSKETRNPGTRDSIQVQIPKKEPIHERAKSEIRTGGKRYKKKMRNRKSRKDWGHDGQNKIKVGRGEMSHG